MSNDLGIENTLELVHLLGLLKKLLLKHLADGAELSDISAILNELLNNPEMVVAIETAIDGIENVIPECASLSMTEKITLISKFIKVMI